MKARIKVTGRTAAPAPWKLEAQDRDRDLWRVRTSEGLVIGPISGKANAMLVALAPSFLAEAVRVTDWTNMGAHRSMKKLITRVRRASL